MCRRKFFIQRRYAHIKNHRDTLTDTVALDAANVAEAERQKVALRIVADAEIDWRKDAVDDGEATNEEEAELVLWRKYRVLLMRIDTSTAPDIEWPKLPVME